MKRLAVILSLVACSLLLQLHCSVASAGEPVVWFCPDAPLKRAEKYHQTDYDYFGLFEQHAEWSRASKHVRIFKVGEGFIFRTGDEQLRKIFAELERRGIELALEAGLLSGTGDCGRGVEGYAAPLGAKVCAEKIARLGGHLKYLAMDEPLWYGCHYSGTNCCHSTMEYVAGDIKAKLAQLRVVFPDLKLGDIEPVAPVSVPGWNEHLAEWIAVYQRVVGEPLAFIHADIDWSGPWPEAVVQLHELLNERHIPMGIIYDGVGTDDKDWNASALANAVFIEDVLNVKPADAIVQSWVANPKYVLPETQTGTMTNLVDLYVASPMQIRLDPEDTTGTSGAASEAVGGIRKTRVAGHLNSADGNALVNVPVVLCTAGGAHSPRSGWQHFDGTIPQGAVKSVFGLRVMINSEPRPTAIGTGEMRFVDKVSGQSVAGRCEPAASGDGRNNRDNRNQITLPPGQKIAFNGLNFPVSGGRPYSFSVNMNVPAAFAGKGFFAIIFLDAQDKQISFDSIDFKYKAGENSRVLGRVKTTEDGSFIFHPEDFPHLNDAEKCYVQFVGGQNHRQTRTADFRMAPW